MQEIAKQEIAKLCEDIRARLGHVRVEAKKNALYGRPTMQERMHGQEDALNWVLPKVEAILNVSRLKITGEGGTATAQFTDTRR